MLRSVTYAANIVSEETLSKRHLGTALNLTAPKLKMAAVHLTAIWQCTHKTCDYSLCRGPGRAAGQYFEFLPYAARHTHSDGFGLSSVRREYASRSDSALSFIRVGTA